MTQPFVPTFQELRATAAAHPELVTVNHMLTSLKESPTFLALPVPAIMAALIELEAEVRGVTLP